MKGSILNRQALTTVMLSAVLLLSACSAAPAPSSAETPRPSPTTSSPEPQVEETPSLESVADYFAAVASGQPAELNNVAASLTVAGSAAETYARYMAGYTQAVLDGGQPLYEDDSIETLADGFRLCPTVSSVAAECNEFTNLVFEDGKLSDFDAGGTPVSGRIKAGSAEPVPLGNVGSIRFLASYLSISNNLIVVLEATSNIDGLNLSYSSSYQAPDGRQSTAAEMVGPYELRSGSLANFAYVFPAAQFGGVLNLQAFDADYNEFLVQIPTN